MFTLSLSAGEWKSIKSEHFKISYEEEFEEMAILSIKYLEEIDSYLSKLLDSRPDFTNIVISDTIDTANGWARVIPYNLIHLYPFAPEVTSELGNYKSWLYILLLHEYVHITHIDKKGLFSKIINKIFGKVMAPNQVLPRFITEGIAVYIESLITKTGRINSSYYKMLFRTSILNHDITLSQLTHFSSHYPYGGTVYLYGSFFIDYIFKKDFTSLAKFIKNYGNNIIPYGINRSLKQSKGSTFEDKYIEFKKYYLKKFTKLKKKIENSGITKYKTILKFDKKYILPIFHDRKITGQNVSFITLSEKNELYLLASGAENRAALYKYKNNKTEKIIDFQDSVSNIEVVDNKLFYISTVIKNKKYLNRFTYFDLKTKKTNILNDSLRVVNFKLNPKTYEAILVVNESGIQNLYNFNLVTQKYTRLTNFKKSTTIDIPSFMNKDELLLSMNQGEDSFWNLYRFSIKDKKLTQITDNNFTEYSVIAGNSKIFATSPNSLLKKEANIISHKKPPLGGLGPSNIDNYSNSSIYFISDREDDILNIYEYDLKNKIFTKKTNFLTGIKQILYDHTKDIFYALRYQVDNGFEAIEIKKSDLISNIVKKDDKNLYYDFLANKKDVKYEKSDFSVFPELFPKNFYPQLSSSNFESSISVIISNSDVREYLGYNLYLSYLFDIKDILFTFSYFDSIKDISYSLAYSYTPFIDNNFIVNGKKMNYKAQYHTFLTNFSIPISDYYGMSQLYLSLAYKYYTFSRLEYDFKPWHKRPILPSELEKINFAFGYFYSKTSELLKTPGISKGTILNLRFALTERDLYANYNSLTFAMQLKHYVPIDLLNASIAIKYYFSILTSENGLTKQKIGGTPDNGSITDSLIDQTSVSGNYLRGYKQLQFEGSLINLLNIEYRQHLFYPSLGYQTLPFYIHEVYFRIFYDIANITDSFYEINTKAGLGGELIVSFILSYYGVYNMAIGYSKGIDKEGINHFYLNFISLF